MDGIDKQTGKTLPAADSIVIFFTASVLLGIAPGPDNIFVLAQSAIHGCRAGLVVTLGLCSGLLIHTLAVTLGVAAVFQTSETAFTLLKLVGAAYLLYLAWQAFRASSRNLSQARPGVSGFLQLYRRGIIMNVTNPKVSIFFLAFLPQFADPSKGFLAGQLVMLGLVFIIATLLVFGTISLLAGTLGGWLNHSSKAQRMLNRMAGVVFAGLAIRLLFVDR
ncbi:MAG: LysE family translocator [Gammaproteobacteria bacterium]|nr:LysE family translocator [Gammaproteobacteria bacterium]